MKLWNKFMLLWRGNRLEQTMAEEMQAHLDGLTERNVAAGMSPDEARHAALRQFGNLLERCFEVSLDVVRERFQRRDVDHSNFVCQLATARLAYQLVQADEERR